MDKFEAEAKKLSKKDDRSGVAYVVWALGPTFGVMQEFDGEKGDGVIVDRLRESGLECSRVSFFRLGKKVTA